VTGVVAQVLRDREAADQGRLKAGRNRVMLCGGDLQRWSVKGVAGAEVVNQQKGCEEEENQ
jgi:hypothetical protein